MNIVTYFGKNDEGDFGYTENDSFEIKDYYDMDKILREIIGCANNHVFLKDFKSGDTYRFLKSGDVITSQTKRIDSETGKMVQLKSRMIGRVYEPIFMQVFFE